MLSKAFYLKATFGDSFETWDSKLLKKAVFKHPPSSSKPFDSHQITSLLYDEEPYQIYGIKNKIYIPYLSRCITIYFDDFMNMELGINGNKITFPQKGEKNLLSSPADGIYHLTTICESLSFFQCDMNPLKIELDGCVVMMNNKRIYCYKLSPNILASPCSLNYSDTIYFRIYERKYNLLSWVVDEFKSYYIHRTVLKILFVKKCHKFLIRKRVLRKWLDSIKYNNYLRRKYMIKLCSRMMTKSVIKTFKCNYLLNKSLRILREFVLLSKVLNKWCIVSSFNKNLRLKCLSKFVRIHRKRCIKRRRKKRYRKNRINKTNILLSSFDNNLKYNTENTFYENTCMMVSKKFMEIKCHSDNLSKLGKYCVYYDECVRSVITELSKMDIESFRFVNCFNMKIESIVSKNYGNMVLNTKYRNRMSLDFSNLTPLSLLQILHEKFKHLTIDYSNSLEMGVLIPRVFGIMIKTDIKQNVFIFDLEHILEFMIINIFKNDKKVIKLFGVVRNLTKYLSLMRLLHKGLELIIKTGESNYILRQYLEINSVNTFYARTVLKNNDLMNKFMILREATLEKLTLDYGDLFESTFLKRCIKRLIEKYLVSKFSNIILKYLTFKNLDQIVLNECSRIDNFLTSKINRCSIKF